MHGSPLPREARRRPELDLLAGPLEAAAAAEAAETREPQLTLVELSELSDQLGSREEG